MLVTFKQTLEHSFHCNKMKQPLEKLLGKEIQNNQEAMMMGDDDHATSTAHLAVPPHMSSTQS